MNCEKIELSTASGVSIIPFILEKPAKSNSRNPFILVVPGGGFTHFGQKEQESVAQFWNSKGFSSAVLYYTLAPFKFPDALFDLSRAVAFIREKSDEWNIDKDRIYLCGFSAGGYLCAALGCWWNSPLLKSGGFNPEQIKPDALCLCYPVISADKAICHEGSIQHLTENLSEEECIRICELTSTQIQDSDNPKEKIREALSLERHVGSDFPRTFIWHTEEDKSVPPQNTLRLAESLMNKGICFEYHLFEKGLHGLSLAQDTPAHVWTEMFENWLAE